MSLWRRCFAQVDASSVGWFKYGWVDPVYAFSYPGLEWIRAWPSEGMYVHLAVVALAALCISLGLLYRLAASVFCLAWTYLFLIDQTHFVNHFYLISLLGLLLVFVPAHRAFSLDARLFPAVASPSTPAWSLWLLRAQIGVVYFFAGVAKLNADWFRGEPVRTMFASEFRGLPIDPEWAVFAVSYGGLGFDLGIVPALLWKRTRALAFGTAVLFHLANARLFNIGVFPWMMIAATTIFLSPGWPRALWRRGRRIPLTPLRADAPPARLGPSQWITLVLLALYLAVQVAVPLRHVLYDGNPSWTRDGHSFSWRVMMLSTDPVPRYVLLRVRDRNTGATWTEDPRQYASVDDGRGL